MCCNGVIFHNVRLQPNDSLRELLAHGLKFKSKHTEKFVLQPCPAYLDSKCSIYQQRPERCHLFECRQLRRVASGEISESAALEKIQEAVNRAARVDQLLNQSGKNDPKKPLSKRYEKITAEPVDLSGDPEVIELRSQLTLSMQALTDLLDKDFCP